MIPPSLLTENINVRRRRDVGRDSLNNPTYGNPTDGDGWYTAIENFPVKLAFSKKGINFAPEGERVQPVGIMYYNGPIDIREEDHILTDSGIEYVVIGISKAYLMANVIDHYEGSLQLP